MIAAALLGMLAASGVLLLVNAAPWARRIRLADRVAPYLGDTSLSSPLWVRAAAAPGIGGAARRLLLPALREATTFVDRLVGGAASVRRRLAGLANDATLEQFRLEQVIWGCSGLLGGGLLVVLGGATLGHVQPILVVVAAVGGAVCGVLGRDWWHFHPYDSGRTADRAQPCVPSAG